MGRAHFPHQLQGTLNFPFFHFVGEAGVYAEERVVGVDGLWLASGDENGGGLNQPY